jgi:hypothetical protein
MELADPAVIASLSDQKRTRRPRPTVGISDGPNETRRWLHAPKRCKCGKCAMCVDNARWERIFTEKFADPNYYAPKPAQLGSSLGWLL